MDNLLIIHESAILTAQILSIQNVNANEPALIHLSALMLKLQIFTI